MAYFAFDVLEGRFGDLNRIGAIFTAGRSSFLNDLQAERELRHVRVYNPRIFMPTHHDGSDNELWRSTEPFFQSIKESVTVARRCPCRRNNPPSPRRP